MARVYNFGAGPAMLPEVVLQQAQEELLDWQGSGMSIVEISHRSKKFMALVDETTNLLRELLAIPNQYKIIFLAAPCRSQFAMIPLNCIGNKTQADYLDTGLWSHQAIKEAKRYTNVNIVSSSENNGYTTIAKPETWKCDPTSAYLYYCANETVNGLALHEIPDAGTIPLACDMTSCFLAQPVDITRFGIVFAGAQKNIAPAGMTIVIVREDLIGHANAITPTTDNYQVNAAENSLYYTPNSFSIYMANLNFKWLQREGGLSAMQQCNQTKAKLLYEYIDNSGFYHNPVDPNYRSIMNVPFTLADQSLDESFLAEASRAGLAELKGHRTVGGMRASLYNAMPKAGVEALITFMQKFAKAHT